MGVLDFVPTKNVGIALELTKKVFFFKKHTPPRHIERNGGADVTECSRNALRLVIEFAISLRGENMRD